MLVALRGRGTITSAPQLYTYTPLFPPPPVKISVLA